MPTMIVLMQRPHEWKALLVLGVCVAAIVWVLKEMTPRQGP